MKKVERRKERELALLGLFRMDFEDSEVPASVILEDFSDEDHLADIKSASGEYADEVVKAYRENSQEVDALIEKYLKKGWNLKKIAKADKAILRLAITEMLMTENPVPKEIAINEAVELAKKYGEEKSASYINGVLNQVAKQKVSDNA